jgi:hypothetical protein
MHFSQRVARLGNWRGLAVLGLLALAGSSAAQAQSLGYLASNAQNDVTTYADLGSAGTVITTPNTDDSNSAPQNIGFTFNFNSQPFTQFVLNTNGFIKLGDLAPSGQTNAIGSIDAADVNIVAPISYADLYGALNQTASPTEYRVSTTGAAGNRVCTIQFKNLADKPSATIPGQYATMQFQIKLYETSNTIEFVYGTWTATAAAATSQPFVIGLKGSSNAVANRVMTSKAAAAAWSTTTFTAGSTGSLVGHFTTNAALPDPGRTYRFRTAQQNDAEVQVIYSLAKLPRGAASPHTVQAVVRNVGLTTQTSLPVTLAVTGANTYTNSKVIGTLAPGASATVTFDPYTPANLGANTLTVSLPLPDDVTTNNARTYSQQVTDNVFSYSNATTSSASVGITATNPTGAFLAKYTTTAARTVTGANIFLSTSTVAANTSVGRTVFAVVLSSNGTQLARSADYVVQAADINTSKSFTFATPAAVPAGDFFVGIGVVNPSGSAVFYPASFQGESPTRAGAFYIAAPLNATGANTLSDIAQSDYGALMVEAVLNTTTGVSKALQSSVNLYPNPSAGQVTLEVRGANAQQGLRVEVSNLLGQRVYAGALRDNFTNQLDLSRLTNGLYTVKVSDGDQYMMRTITISK